MPSSPRRVPLACLLGVVAFASLAGCRNQSRTGVRKSVQGTVRSEAGVLAQAQVCAWKKGPRVQAVRDDVAPRCTQSDEAGSYRLEIETGVWQVVAVAGRQQPQRQVLILRGSAPTPTLDFTLAPGGRRFANALVDLEGRVVPRARVDAYVDGVGPSGTTHTDEAGQFELWSAANASLRVTAPGFMTAVSRGDGTHVALPESVLAGRVVNELGVPIEGARVAQVDTFGPSYGFANDATRTDKNGTFRLTGLPPGRYHLIAHTDEAGGEIDDVAVAFAQTRDGLEITLSKPLSPLRARVADADGTPVGGCMVGLVPKGSDHIGRSRLYAWTDEDGLFDVPIRRGHYLVDSLSCPDRIGLPPYPTLAVDRSGNAIPTLTVGPGRPLRGRLLDDAGAPLADVRVLLQPPEPELGARRREADAGANTNPYDFLPLDDVAVTDVDGRFEWSALPPGIFEVAVLDWPKLEAWPRVEIGADASTPVEATFTLPATGRIELRSSSARARQQITVRSCPARHADEPWQTTRATDAEGVAIVEHAPPGMLVAGPSREDARDDAQAARCDADGERFEVVAGQTTRVAVAADNASPLVVRVVDRAGDPVANAVVGLRSDLFHAPSSTDWWLWPEALVITDAQGRARFESRCGSESCSVTAARPGQFAVVSVAAGQQGELTLAL